MEYQQVRLFIFSLGWLDVKIECSLLHVHHYHVMLIARKLVHSKKPKSYR